MTAYTSAASGAWNNTTTWSPNGVPGASDTVTIAAGHTVTVEAGGTEYASAVTVLGGLSLVPLNPGTTTLTVGGGTGTITVGQAGHTGGIFYLESSGEYNAKLVVNAEVEFVGCGVPFWEGLPRTRWVESPADIPGPTPGPATTLAGLNAIVGTQTGWQSTDHLVVAPTLAGSYVADELTTSTSTTAHDHPLVTLNTITAVGGGGAITTGTHVYGAEVANVTSNVSINGGVCAMNDPSSTAISPAPVITNVKMSGSASFGFGLINMNNAWSGATFSNNVIRDCADHGIYYQTAYETYASNGITWQNNVIYNVSNGGGIIQSMDPNPTTNTPPLNSTTYLDNLVLRTSLGDGGTGSGAGAGIMYANSGTGTNKSSSHGNRVVAHAYDFTVQFNSEVGAHSWPGLNITDDGVWDTDGDTPNFAHNCGGHGIMAWQNTGTTHPVDDYVLYNNAGWGIRNGAYSNPYCYEGCTVGANTMGAASLPAVASSDLTDTIMWQNDTFDASGAAYCVVNTEHGPVTDPTAQKFLGCYFTGQGTAIFGMTRQNNGANDANGGQTFNTPDLIYCDANCVFDGCSVPGDYVFFGANQCTASLIQLAGPGLQFNTVGPTGSGWTMISTGNYYKSYP